MRIISLACLAIAIHSAPAQAQTCGFDYIGPDSTASSGNSFFTSQLFTDFPNAEFVAGMEWTADVDQQGQVLWMVLGAQGVDTAGIQDFTVDVWGGLSAAMASPSSGSLYHRTTLVPDYGDLTTPFGSTLNGFPTYLIGMDLDDLNLRAGFDYFFAIYARNNFTLNGLLGAQESSIVGPSGHQYGAPASAAPGWTMTANLAASQHGGVLAYRLESSTVTYQGTGCGGGTVGVTPSLQLQPDCPVVGGVLDPSIDGLTPGTAGFLLASLGVSAPLDLGAGCVLRVDIVSLFPVLPVTADAFGSWSSSIPLPSAPALAGQVFSLQGATVGSAGPLGFDLSNGARFTLTL